MNENTFRNYSKEELIDEIKFLNISVDTWKSLADAYKLLYTHDEEELNNYRKGVYNESNN